MLFNKSQCVTLRAIAVELKVSEAVIVELLNDELTMFDNVLSAFDIVLFVSVSVVVSYFNKCILATLCVGVVRIRC